MKGLPRLSVRVRSVLTRAEKIGEIHRLVDEAGNDVMRHSFGIQRVVDALNAFRKVFDPVEYRAAIEADCRKLEDQRRAAWAEYESLIGFRDLAA